MRCKSKSKSKRSAYQNHISVSSENYLYCHSNPWDDPDPYPWPRPCPPPHPEPKPEPHHEPETVTILNCGTANGSTLLSFNGPIGPGPIAPKVLATVPLSTDGLIDPTVKIDFSSLITFRTFGTDNYSLRLTFRLSRICGGAPVPLSEWTFEKSSFEVDGPPPPPQFPQPPEFSQQIVPFCFSWCQCDTIPDGCQYIVELVEAQYSNITFARVDFGSLTALAVGKKVHHF